MPVQRTVILLSAGQGESETIDRFRVSAVVHGHAHRGQYEGRTPRGVPVYNVAYAVPKPTGQPYALIEV